MNTTLALAKKLGRVGLMACAAAALLPAAAGAADLDVVSIEILVDGVQIAQAKTRLHEPVTVQIEDHGPILGIYPDHVDLRGERVTLSVYEVEDLREVGSRDWLENVDLTTSGAVSLDRAGRQVNRTLEVRLIGVQLAGR